ncbi:hypothetical protein D3C76_1063190 [compost metagenome]|uniref:NUDIX hydrolase n=1 Tax=unclassified Pseudomonas TaxID=196821 RepID=UPI000FAF608C|nr:MULTISPECIES: NUDIX domain-containing protein [unclassified Pseudomonas]MDH0302261.1 NUDIX domain-containing protein [Pseudomonas sp. GD04091]MDH1986008.1 NUDIX domain-containing protein [Pseudomonas sp. GD03689]
MVRRRLASRILLISEANRLLLFNIRYCSGVLAGRCYWATPGGQLRDDETFETAAIRELYEETGIQIQSVGQCVALREFPWQMPDGEQVIASEQYFVVRVQAELCSRGLWSVQEREAVHEARWWSEAELASIQEDVFPHGLQSLFATALENLPPAVPIGDHGRP